MNYSLKTTNIHLIKALFEIAKENGIGVCENYEDYIKTNNFVYQYFILSDKEGVVGGKVCYGELVSIEKMFDLLSETKGVRLNNDYVAIISKEEKLVRVGCQEFSFDVINKLYDTIHGGKK